MPLRGVTKREVLADFRRAELVDAASAVFARKGFAGASVDEIAKMAGVAKGTVYLYYPSKHDIYWAALESGGAVHHDPKVKVPLAMMNRHGLIAGATGTGKTKTLQLLTEQLVAHGVPVFVADIKGDLSGLAMPGDSSDRGTGRAQLHPALRGRPPFAPFARAAAALAGEVARPARRASSLIQARVPNTPFSRPRNERSASRDGQ